MPKTYLNMTPNEIHNALTKRIPQPEARELKKQELLNLKHKLKSERLRTIQHKRLWSELLSPLVYELANARVGIKHESKYKGEREVAFNAYIAVMDKLLNKFKQMQLLRDEDNNPYTPSELARQADIQNKGVHWTDWIPMTKQLQVCELFEQIPHAPKTKRKVPFQRTQRPNTKQRERLLNRTIKELGNAQTEQLIEPTEERAELISQMQNAIKRIEQLKPTDAVPHTWHGLED